MVGEEEEEEEVKSSAWWVIGIEWVFRKAFHKSCSKTKKSFVNLGGDAEEEEEEGVGVEPFCSTTEKDLRRREKGWGLLGNGCCLLICSKRRSYVLLISSVSSSLLPPLPPSTPCIAPFGLPSFVSSALPETGERWRGYSNTIVIPIAAPFSTLWFFFFFFFFFFFLGCHPFLPPTI